MSFGHTLRPNRDVGKIVIFELLYIVISEQSFYFDILIIKFTIKIRYIFQIENEIKIYKDRHLIISCVHLLVEVINTIF